jgi:predicted DNA-binding transcriptional regulator YafY
MPERYETGEKFVRVIQLFQRLCDTEIGLTTAQLAADLEVTTRSVQRYISTLRDSVGIDIIEQEGRFRIGDYSRLPPMQLDRYQATALLIALRLLYKMSSSQDPALIGALAQLARALRVPAVTRYLESTLAAAEQRPENIERGKVEHAVIDAFVNHQTLGIDYRDKNGKLSKRSLRPYFLEPRPEGRTVYVIGYDEKSGEVRAFRLDRISQAAVIGPSFTVPEDFNIDRVLSSAWGIWFGDTNDEVVLRFDASVADRVREQNWHPEATLTEDADGNVEMRVKVASEVEMRPWVLGWGSVVEVLAPASLREHVAAQTLAASRLYRD